MLQDAFCHLVSLATEAHHCWHQLEVWHHVNVHSVATGAEPHQNNLALPGQEVAAILLRSRLYNCPDDAPLLNTADTMGATLVSLSTLFD